MRALGSSTLRPSDGHSNRTYNHSMANDLYGSVAQQKRILSLLRRKAKFAGVRNLKELIPEPPLNGRAKNRISKGFAKAGAPKELLGVIGSWADTFTPDAIEDLLENGYEMDTIFASTSD